MTGTQRTGHVFTACYILTEGGLRRERIIDEIRCHLAFHAEVNPLSHGPVLAVDIPVPASVYSEASAGALLADALHRLPCGAIVEWLVPRRGAAQAMGMYAVWEGIASHPDLVELDQAHPERQP